jgi:hypothetical protein
MTMGSGFWDWCWLLLCFFSVLMLSGFLNYLPERQKTANIKCEKNHFQEGFSFFNQIRKLFYHLDPDPATQINTDPVWIGIRTLVNRPFECKQTANKHKANSNQSCVSAGIILCRIGQTNPCFALGPISSVGDPNPDPLARGADPAPDPSLFS